MRILITGASGYIGTRLLTALLAPAGAWRDVAEVVVVDIRPPRVTDPRVRYEARSVTEDMRDLLADPRRPVDVALHLAWCVDPLRDAAKQREICIGGTRRFLDGCSAGGVKQVLFVSSMTAYGANPAHAEPVPEYEPLKERWHFQYSAEKREAEGLCRRFAEDRPGTLLQIVRPAIVGGPNVSNFIFRGMDRPVNFMALGYDPPIQFVHEDDAAEAILAVARSRLPGAFNIAADGLLRLSEAYGVLGVERVVRLPLQALRAALAAAWRFNLRKISEAPADFMWFLVHPCLMSNRRLKEEVGFLPRIGAREVLESFRRARLTGAAGSSKVSLPEAPSRVGV